MEKKIFSIMRHHQPGVIISWTFISRQDNKCPVAQLFLTNLPIVFHPPPEHRLPVFNVFPSFPALPRFLSFFSFSFPSLLFSLLSFSLAFERTRATKVEGDGGDTFNKGKTRGVNLNIFSPFRSISATISFSFHLIYERVYTSYFSNRYNKDRKTQSIILDRDK